MRGSQPWRTVRARSLRTRRTDAEHVLWQRLRNRQVGGCKFIRQAAIGAYFVDFVCREKLLVVEIDGATHSSPSELASDAERTAELERLGYRIIRVGNRDVYDNIAGVLDLILAALENRLPS